jgi:hypothetical protein
VNGQDPLQIALSGGLQLVVDLFRSRAVLDHRNEIDNRHVRSGNADRIPVEFALQFRHNEPDRLRRARRGRDHVDGRGTRATEILVREVEDVLVIRVAVNRRHQALLDDELFMQNFHHRSEAVRGAGRVRDYVMLARVVFVVIDAENESDIFVRRQARR